LFFKATFVNTTKEGGGEAIKKIEIRSEKNQQFVMKRSESDGELSGEEDAFSLENPSLRGGGKSGKQHHYNGSDDYLVLGDGDDLSSSGEQSARTVSAEIYSLNKVLKEPCPSPPPPWTRRRRRYAPSHQMMIS
jgi:hypothetical protein